MPKKVIYSILILCLLVSGCGQSSIREDASDAADAANTAAVEETVTVPVYSEEDHKASADYIRTQYGVLTGAPPKVILDCDMTYLGDDAMCMCILAQADTLGLIELTGVTITGGNSFTACGANAALNQLERIGRSDIPVYIGTDVPIGGFRDMEKQEEIIGKMSHYGALYRVDDYVAPEKYHDLGVFYERKWGYSQTEPKSQSSVDFMIQQVLDHPGEITLISVGAPTNIAMACQKEETFAGCTAGIIYMGMTVNGKGTYTPYADFNCFYDAEAFQICINSDFPTQTAVPHEASEYASLNKAVFDLMDAKNDTLISQMWLEDKYSLFKRTPTRTEGCPDAIAAVVFLYPEVISGKEDLLVEINTDVSVAEYGQTTTWTNGEEAPDGSCITFVMELDTALYWDFVTDIICHMQTGSTDTYASFSAI